MYSYKNRTLFYGLKNPSPFPSTSRLGAAIVNFFGSVFPTLAGTLVSRPIVLNTEEMASLFHFPGAVVSSPTMPRMQSKQAEPPINLPVG
jgi:hypothetical protein